MRRFGKVVVTTVLPLALVAEAAAAQVAGIPVYYNPSGGTGLSAAANFGIPDNNGGKGSAWALTGGYGTGPLSVTATFGNRSPKGVSSYSTFGGTVAVRVFGGGLLPVSIAPQAGVGYFKSGNVSQVDIPIGVGLLFSPPLFPLKPWVAPRVQLTHQAATGGVLIPCGTTTNNTSCSGTGFGASAGVNFSLLLGLGVHAAVDWLQLDKKFTGGTSSKSTVTFGVGAHYNFTIPLL